MRPKVHIIYRILLGSEYISPGNHGWQSLLHDHAYSLSLQANHCNSFDETNRGMQARTEPSSEIRLGPWCLRTPMQSFAMQHWNSGSKQPQRLLRTHAKVVPSTVPLSVFKACLPAA